MSEFKCNEDWCVAGDCDAHHQLDDANAKIKDLEARLRRAEADLEECQRVKDKAFLVARDVEGTQKAAFELLKRAKDEILMLRDVLKPFAKARDFHPPGQHITLHDLTRAKEALKAFDALEGERGGRGEIK